MFTSSTIKKILKALFPLILKATGSLLTLLAVHFLLNQKAWLPKNLDKKCWVESAEITKQDLLYKRTQLLWAGHGTHWDCEQNQWKQLQTLGWRTGRTFELPKYKTTQCTKENLFLYSTITFCISLSLLLITSKYFRTLTAANNDRLAKR